MSRGQGTIKMIKQTWKSQIKLPPEIKNNINEILRLTF